MTRIVHNARGEHKEEYSHSFRQWELLSSLSATLADKYGVSASDQLHRLTHRARFENAFHYDPYIRTGALPGDVHLSQVAMYNQASQYLQFDSEEDNNITISSDDIAKAISRCSLIHLSYLVVANGANNYSALVDMALQSNDLDDLKETETKITWRVKRHEFSFVDGDNNPRFGRSATRSITREWAALPHLELLLCQFKGEVNLEKPSCDIHLLEGLSDNDNKATNSLIKILARVISKGATHSIMSPKTRICVTKTPLESIAAYLLCNIAMVQQHQTVLDPFAGSCATLLAAALNEPSVRTVGIEIAPDKLISRSDIREDFKTRGLTEPIALLEGDVFDVETRDKAKEAIGTDEGFDVIITDPPYGIREATLSGGVGQDSKTVLNDLVDTIIEDRKRGRPLLKAAGGKLVVFQPCPRGLDIQDLLPSPERLCLAGLQLQEKREQKLRDGLSRWVVSFIST